MKNKVLFFDLDGVLANFNKKILELHGQELDMHNYKDNEKIVDEICLNNPRIFSILELMEQNAVDVVLDLMTYYNVYFLSTPMWILPESWMDKRIWVEKHFGKHAVKKLILTHRKDLCVGDFLVDDRKVNGAAEFSGEHIHFGTEQFPDLQTVKDYLISKL